MTLRSLKLGMAAVAAAVTIVVGAPPAHAAGELRIDVAGNGPLVDLTQIIPGGGGRSTFSVANASDQVAALTFRIVGLNEDDNGCVRPETTAGDDSCGAGGGELGRDLIVTVAPLDADGRTGDPVVQDSLRRLTDATVIDPLLPAGTVRAFRLDWQLAAASPNDTQTDTATFDAEFVLTQAFDDVDPEIQPAADPLAPTVVDDDVLGAVITKDEPRAIVQGATLPRSGGSAERVVPLGLASVIAGCVLRLMTRRRDRYRAG